MTSLIVSLAIAQSCQNYSAHCDCFPAVPFEGHKMYVVEKCDGKEEWYTEYAAPTFDTDEACRAAIPNEPVCKNLPEPTDR